MKQRLLYLFFRMWLIAMVSAGIGSSVQVLAQPTPHILKSLEPTQTIQQLQIVRDPSRSLTIDEVAQRYRVAPRPMPQHSIWGLPLTPCGSSFR